MKNLSLTAITLALILFCSNTFVDVTESQILVGTEDVCALAGNPDYTLVLDIGSAFKQDGGMWSIPVDEALIANEEDFNRGMEVLTELKLVQGTYNGKGNTIEGQPYVGVDSRAISKYMSGMLDTVMIYMEKGATEKQPMTIINPSALPYITINATKELNHRTALLETKMQQLEETEIRLNTLQRQLDELEERFNGLGGNTVESVVSQAVEKEIAEPEIKPELFQNYPNPVSSRTTIPYFLPDNVNNAYIVISNMLGQQIKQIPVEGKGRAEITLNLKVSPSAYGTYTYTLVADGEIITAKNMILGM